MRLAFWQGARFGFRDVERFEFDRLSAGDAVVISADDFRRLEKLVYEALETKDVAFPERVRLKTPRLCGRCMDTITEVKIRRNGPHFEALCPKCGAHARFVPAKAVLSGDPI